MQLLNIRALLPQIRYTLPLNLTILSRKQPRLQKWELKSGQLSKPLPHSALSSDSQLFSKKRFLYSSLSEKQLRIFRKRKTLFHFGAGFRHSIHRIIVRQDNKNQEKSLVCRKRKMPTFSVKDLRPIFKAAKNLKFLYVKYVCDKSILKSIRKARGLQDLSLRVDKRTIMAYPQFFKGLTSLQKVKLYLGSCYYMDNQMISKFFGFLLELPKLYHLMIWLDEGSDYYKILLHAIHQKKLSSFHIIVTVSSDLQSSLIDWGNYIDTLILCPIYHLGHTLSPKDIWSPSQKPEKILRLQHGSRIDDLLGKNIAIKNFKVHDLRQANSSADDFQKITMLISQAKLLENLVLSLEVAPNSGAKFMSTFNQYFYQMESPENLHTFYFGIKREGDRFLLTNDFFQRPETESEKRWESPTIFAYPDTKILPPYSGKMKNLRTLCLRLGGPCFDLCDFTEALKGLLTLEEFYFYLNAEHKNRDEKVECKLPFEWLKNLRLIRVGCSSPFSESSINQLVGSVSKMEKLNHLEIGGQILEDLDQEEAIALKKNLCANQSLKILSLHSKEDFLRVTYLVKINGEWVRTSKR